MFDVQTDHQIVALNTGLMHLLDCHTGALIATAEHDKKGWLVQATGVPDVTVTGRGAAITALTEQALAVLDGTGYSTMVPTGLAEQP